MTIRDIAKLTGFSSATVSMALRDSPKISEAVRKKIHAAATKAGYRPNPLMAAHWQTVRARKPPGYHSTIAILNDQVAVKTWRGSHWGGELLKHFNARATELGYLTEEFFVGHENDAGRREKLAQTVKVLKARGISAYAIFLCGHPRIFLESEALFGEFAGVFISTQFNVFSAGENNTSVHLPFHRVNPDRYGNMLMLLDQVRELGYCRPGFWPNHWMEGSTAGEAAAAFNFYLRNLPASQRLPALPPRWQLDVPLTALKPEFMKWIVKSKPDVVICENFEVRQWIKEAGLRVPEDVGLVHLSLGSLEKGWSGINPRHDQVASAGADLLTAHLQRNERGTPPFPKETRIDGVWVAGDSTRKIS